MEALMSSPSDVFLGMLLGGLKTAQKLPGRSKVFEEARSSGSLWGTIRVRGLPN